MAKVELEGNREVYRLMLKAMPIGLAVRLPSNKGYVKHHSFCTFVLFDDSNRERSRWGTLEQIADDVEFFETNGTLPPADMPRW